MVMHSTSSTAKRLPCPRCNKRDWLDPKPYTKGGPELRRCRACGFSLRVAPLVNIPGIPITTRVVLGANGRLTRVKYSGYSGEFSGERFNSSGSDKPQENVSLVQGAACKPPFQSTPGAPGHTLSDACCPRPTHIAQGDRLAAVPRDA